jgi:gamma-glutamyltranspeptidase/glutathione hydrolase
MVVTADQYASMAGTGILTAGGSAADAIVAAATVMAVTGPHLCGMGGDALAVVARPGDTPCALLAVGRAGAGAEAAALRVEGHRVMPLRGDLRSVTVPGAVDGWLALHDRWGRLSLSSVLEPAISLAEEGFSASTLLALSSPMVAQVPGADDLCPDGKAPGLGQAVRLPRVAICLRALVEGGRDAHYLGPFGTELLEMGAGLFERADFERSLAEWVEPLTVRAFGHDLWTVPPPSQGYLTLAGAWCAEAAGLGADPEDPAFAHLLVEAARAVGHDRPAVLFDGTPGDRLLDPDRMGRAAARISVERAAPPDVLDTPATPRPEARLGDGDTTHLCAIDAQGLAISLTQSNALDFGSHLMAQRAGVFLHNRGVGFSLESGHPAELAPGRRPPHTLSPALVTRPDGTLAHVIGAMGGDAQPQILLQLVARLCHVGQDPATAMAAARFALDAPSAGPFRSWHGADLTVRLEVHAPPSWAGHLVARGHRVQPIMAFDPVSVGCAQLITVDPPSPSGNGGFQGVADPRSPEGAAIGL